MKIFNLINKNGITLHTENKYCNEDIAVGLSPDDQNNLIANNIKSGVSILGITGTYEGNGSSGDYENWDGTFEGNAEIIPEGYNVYIASAYSSALPECSFDYSLDNGVT
jgi:hypothetical protein